MWCVGCVCHTCLRSSFVFVLPRPPEGRALAIVTGGEEGDDAKEMRRNKHVQVVAGLDL